MAKTGWVWDGSQFVALTAPVGAFPNAVSNYGSIAPTSPKTGQTWFDTGSQTIKIWSGSAWIEASSSLDYQSTQPSTATTGQLWIDSDDNKMYVWNGSSWVTVGGGSSDDYETVLAMRMFF